MPAGGCAGREDRYEALLREVTHRTAAMIAWWQAVGFVHGVCNTDNFSILGETIDYGCGDPAPLCQLMGSVRKEEAMAKKTCMWSSTIMRWVHGASRTAPAVSFCRRAVLPGKCTTLSRLQCQTKGDRVTTVHPCSGMAKSGKVRRGSLRPQAVRLHGAL